MRKFITFASLAATVLGMCTGCVASEIGVKLNSDETGSISTTVGIDEDSVASFTEMGTTLFDGQETTTYEHNGKTYVAVSETAEYDSFDEIETALLELDFADDEIIDSEEPELESLPVFRAIEIEKHGGLFFTAYSFRAELNPQTTSELDGAMLVTLSVEMPSKITDSNGELDGNKVTFEIDDFSKSDTFYAVSEQTNGFAILIIRLVIVSLIGLLFVLIKGRDSGGGN